MNKAINYVFSSKDFKPRKNLPDKISTKKKESFLTSEFIKQLLHNGGGSYQVLVKEFNLNGYGISDILSFQYRLNKNRNIIYKRITSFEIKIKDWRRALAQAYRYKYYSNRSIVLLPLENIENARKNIDQFRNLEVGLWGYDRVEKKIIKFYTPKHKRPSSKNAFTNALKKLEFITKLPLAS